MPVGGLALSVAAGVACVPWFETNKVLRRKPAVSASNDPQIGRQANRARKKTEVTR